MAELKLRTVTRTQGNNKALKDGTVKPRTCELEFVEVDPLIDAFRRMVRGLEFDVSEMAITTYLTARAHGKAFTALPVFVMRQFHHAPILYNVKSGVKSPKDLEGKKVGVRAYTVTTGVWARGILASEYGVDLDKVTWVVVDEEHVQEYQKPANVLERPGANLGDMLVKGELAAAIGAGQIDSPDVKPLIADAREAEAAWYRKTGIYPLNHTVVVKDDLVQANPDLAPEIFNAFAAAKRLYVQRLAAGEIQQPSADDVFFKRVMDVTGDPLPYGLGPNRRMLDAIVRHAAGQGIIPRPVAVEELFPANTHTLTA